MIRSKIVVLGVAALSVATCSLLSSGCSHGANPPAGGTDPATLGQQNVAGQAEAYQQRLSHDPTLHQGAPVTSGQEAGQAAAMHARMQAQGQHP